MAGKLSVLPGDTPNLSDWENHLTTIFPEVYTEFLPYPEILFSMFYEQLLCKSHSLQIIDGD